MNINIGSNRYVALGVELAANAGVNASTPAVQQLVVQGGWKAFLLSIFWWCSSMSVCTVARLPWMLPLVLRCWRACVLPVCMHALGVASLLSALRARDTKSMLIASPKHVAMPCIGFSAQDLLHCGAALFIRGLAFPCMSWHRPDKWATRLGISTCIG